MPLILPANTGVTAAFSVDNSCRFNDGDTAYMSRTLGTPTNNDKWTFSCWFKRSSLGGSPVLFVGSADADNGTVLKIKSTEEFQWQEYQDAFLGKYTTNRKFRDISSWYHLVCTYDSGNATAGNRMRIYVNGTEETSFADEDDVDQNQNSLMNTAVVHGIGYDTGTGISGAYYFDGYMAEVAFCDGQTYAASDFGEFDEDSPTIWKPKKISGLTFGDNGFYLDFKASGNLGNDANGGTDWAESNIDATDQAVDSPTNNFATTLGSLIQSPDANTYSQGNCSVVTHSSNYYGGHSTIGVSKGKWYFEVEMDAGADISFSGISANPALEGYLDKHIGNDADAFSYGMYGANGNQFNNNNDSSYGDSTADGDIIGVYMDLDNNKLYFAENDTLHSGTGISITAAASTSTGVYHFGVGDGSSGSTTALCNFGGCSAFTVSSANQDANGYGNFEYDPSRGGASDFDSAAKDFLALCSANLATDG